MSAVRTLDSIDWQQTCHGRLAEVQTPKGWLRIAEEGETWVVTRFGKDLMPLGEPETMTTEQVQEALAT